MIKMQRSMSSPVRMHAVPLSGSLSASDDSRNLGDPASLLSVSAASSRSFASLTSKDRCAEILDPLVIQSQPAQHIHAGLPSESLNFSTSLPTVPNNAIQLSGPHSKSLLSDLSLYTNPKLAVESEADTTTTLEEFAHLVRLSRYLERKCANTRLRLHRSLVSAALSARLTRCGEIARRNLAESFRRDDKEKGFASLYNAVHNVRRSWEELRRYTILEPQFDSLQSPGLATPDGSNHSGPPGRERDSVVSPLGSTTPFFSELSSAARDAFVHLLVQVRTNPHYVAARICAMNSFELNAFVTYHRGLEHFESVLPQTSRASTRFSTGSFSHRASAQPDVERLLSFQRHDPVSTILHTCFANSAGPDSAEDRRRTDIWSSVCARLITESKSGMESFLICTLNVWTAMRDWTGLPNIEWYLMKILQEGAFILDDQYTSRLGSTADRTVKDKIATEEFYEGAVNELFEIVDDEDSTGIPEGLIELGNAILEKLSGHFFDSTRRWFVYRWLFSIFLLGVVVYPESHGLLVNYFIPENARQRILREVAMRAQRMVVDITWASKSSQSQPTAPEKVRRHVESILTHFGSKPSIRRSAAKLLPARSITSLRETVEVHPYLVVSPADLVTLVNALFPERRPGSAASGSIRSGGAPSISSVSGMSSASQPISFNRPSRPVYHFDAPSCLSTSASSTVSDVVPEHVATSGAPDGQLFSSADSVPSTPGLPGLVPRIMTNYEEDGDRLRAALLEMTQVLGQDAVSGSCHPCAEKWAVLFVSSNGSGLSMHMMYDDDESEEEADDDSDRDEHSSSLPESENDEREAEQPRPDLGRNYHQLRDSILKLVEDYEIPRGIQNDGSGTLLTNRVSGLKQYKGKHQALPISGKMKRHGSMSSQGPSVTSAPTSTATGSRDTLNSLASSSPAPAAGTIAPDLVEAEQPVLVRMLMAASAQCRAQSDFVSAHMYWRTSQQLHASSSPSLRDNGFGALLNIFSRGSRDSIRLSAAAIEDYDAWLVWLKQSQERHEATISRMMQKIRALRDKMWYTTEVRNSKEFDHSREVCLALRTMGMARRRISSQRSPPSGVGGYFRGGPASSLLYRHESQIMDLLAASEAEGGPNKLSDDQAEKTGRWLRQYGVENFCGGEERIHRFCCEMEGCISKLIGETIREAPVLWSSDLFNRDKRIIDRAKFLHAREAAAWRDDASSARPGVSMHSAPSTLRDLRSISALNTSQQSIGSGRFSSRMTTTNLSDVLDGSDYFGIASPIHTIDTASTFWSPFQTAPSVDSSTTSRANSPTASVVSLSGASFFNSPQQQQQQQQQHSVHSIPQHRNLPRRPGTTTSKPESSFRQRVDDDNKIYFFRELRQTLTSLLLSDLGTIIFPSGSETDTWFGRLGQECIERREVLEQRARRRATVGPRVTEKKKITEDFREAGVCEVRDHREGNTTEIGSITGTNDAAPRRRLKHQQHKQSEFPFKKAYQRLLKMFSVNPDPYAKLNALSELENLIIAAQTSSGYRRPKSGRARTGPTDSAGVDNEDLAGLSIGPSTLEDAMDSLRERRSQTRAFSPPNSPTAGGSSTTARRHNYRTYGNSNESRPIGSTGAIATNTDAVTEILQSLLKDPSLRPKTLFRDLQYIAAFVPASVLDKTDRGKAFWNAGLASLGLKLEVCRTMVEVGYEVVETVNEMRKTRLVPTATTMDQGGAGSPPPPASSRYTLADAARMYSITAREGFPTAQREVALFYLSNPELMERRTVPLSKPREVFKRAAMAKYGGGPLSRSGGASSSEVKGSTDDDASSPSGRSGDPRDPLLMCVAMHWMEAAAQGGDAVANQFLRQHASNG